MIYLIEGRGWILLTSEPMVPSTGPGLSGLAHLMMFKRTEEFKWVRMQQGSSSLSRGRDQRERLGYIGAPNLLRKKTFLCPKSIKK